MRTTVLCVLAVLCVLSARAATFNTSGTTLQLNLTTANEAIAITAGPTSYTFALTGGTWSGTDSADTMGNGTTTLTATKSSFTAVTVDDASTGNGAVFNDSGANTYSASFTVTMDSTAPGGSTFNGSTVFTGNAALFLQASGVAVNPGAVISTVNGNLTLLGNMQTPGKTGSSNGVNINAATISVSGSGNLTIKGTSGISSATTQMGVRIQGGSVITGGIAGSTVTIEGYGAASSGVNYGLNIKDSGTAITSLGANVVLKGVGGTGTSTGNNGVFLESSTTASAGGAGSISIVAVAGTGGVGLGMSGSVVSTTGTGSISIATDSAFLAGGVSAPGRSVSLAPLTAGKNMDLGSTSDATANTLSLSQAELNTITASTLNLGDANTGVISVSTALTLPGGTTANLTAAVINTNGNTVSGGTVTQTSTNQPIMTVEQPAGTAIASGVTQSFGVVAVGSTSDLVFTVKNTGSGDLTGLTITGLSGTDYSLFTSPTAPVIVGGSTTFTVRLTPTSGGLKTATLTLASNALGAPSFVINLTGIGALPFFGARSVGTTGDFASLTAVLSFIQGNGGITGPTVLELQPGYVSTVETFPLVFTNLGATATNTLTIRPASGATNLSITSADTTAATIDLNGGQFITFDGRPGGTGTAKELTIENTNTAGVALRFINEASRNTVKFVTLKGVNTSTGTVFFSTTTGANGNDNNTLDTCDIRDGATMPVNAIYSFGTTTTTAQNNSGNTFTNCNIFNFYGSGGGSSTGVFLSNGNTDWTISGNSFYQTASRAAVTGSVVPIAISNTSGNNFTVTGNSIGGSAPSCGGTAWTTTGTASYRFVGIQLTVGTTTPSSVQGNTIANIVWTNSSATTTLPGVWTGIYVTAGNANIGTVTGNTIGSGTGTGSISVTSGNGGTTFGIGNASSGTVNIANNTIGSITANGSASTISASLVGIQVTAGANSISNNLVGSTSTANSLNAATSSTSATAQQVTGILSSSTTSASITGNTVANLNNNYAGTATSGQIRGIVTSAGVNTITSNTVRNLSTTSQNTSATTAQSVYGIAQTSTTAGQTVSQNTVHSLANTAASAAVSVTGIYYNGTVGTNLIARNFVHSLAVSSSSASSVLNGMQFVVGIFTVQNNVVRVGLQADGTSTAGSSIVRGIYDNGPSTGRNFYHNSVYLGGTQTSGTANTYAFQSTGTTNTRDYRNNLFVNARSNSGGTGKHYAVNYGGTGTNPTGLNANNNLFLASGTGGVLGLYNTVDRTTLTDWQTATGKDANSLNTDPLYVNPTGDATTVNLHITSLSPAIGAAAALAAVTDDIDSQTRHAIAPTIGADETLSSNANLSALSLSAGTLSPAFSPTLLSYSSSVSFATTSLTANATPAFPFASLSITGGTTLAVGTNTLNVRVTAQDGTTVKTYTITITRNTAFQDWAIANSVSTDPTAKGGANLLNFAFNMNPTSGGSGALSYSGNVITPGTTRTEAISGTPTAEFVRRKDFASVGITYTLQFSADLATWETDATAPDVLADDGTNQVVGLSYPILTGGAQAQFFKVTVSLP